MGVPCNMVTGQRIYAGGEEEVDPDCLGSFLGDVLGW